MRVFGRWAYKGVGLICQGGGGGGGRLLSGKKKNVFEMS